MGTQQLLFIVLGVIVVGIAIIVGLQMFRVNAVEINRDAIVNQAVALALMAQEWYRKPAVLGGGSRSFATFDLRKIGYDGTGVGDSVETESGKIWITDRQTGQMVIHVQGKERGTDGNLLELHVNVYPDSVGDPIWDHE